MKIMMECFRCHIEGSKASLFDAISNEGVVKICASCVEEENLPLLKRPTDIQLKKIDRGGTIYERLSGMAGINPRNHMMKFHPEEARKREAFRTQDVTLRDIVEKNYQKRAEKEKQGETIPKNSLVSNFHWVIMTARRRRKLSQIQVASAINESETAIKVIEAGNLPEDYKLINKLENFLKIKLLREDKKEEIRPFNKKLDFDDVGARNLTISDLREMKKRAMLVDDEPPRAIEGDVDEEIILDEDFESGQEFSEEKADDGVGKMIWRK